MQRQHQSNIEKAIAASKRKNAIARHSTHPIEELQGAIGNRAVNRLLANQPRLQAKPMFRGLSSELRSPTPIQAQLKIGEPGDKYEQQADRVAAQVMQRMQAPASITAREEAIQRQEKGEQEEVMQKSQEQTIQRLEISQLNPKSQALTELETSIQRAREGGQPLAKSVQKPMERAFGADFSQVKVHTDAQSDRLNRSIQARAFTTGQDMFFQQGTYQPESRTGQELIAHELTHVLQQGASRDSRMSAIQCKNGSKKKAKETTNQSDQNQPEQLNQKWKDVELTSNPKLKPEPVVKWELKENENYKEINGSVLASPSTAGNLFATNKLPAVDSKEDVTTSTVDKDTQLYDFKNHSNSDLKLPYDAEMILSEKKNVILPEKKDVILPEKKDVNLPEKKDVNGQEVEVYEVCVSLFGPGGILPYEYWLLATDAKPGNAGHLFKVGSKRYWIKQGDESLQLVSTSYVDRTNNSLFPEDPKPEHILQGHLGDCYLMAALASITQANSKFPREMMQDNQDGTVTVRLYDVSYGGLLYSFQANKRLIKVNKSIARKSGKDVYAQDHLWVQMVQKAYAASGIRGGLLKPKKSEGSFKNIEGGSSSYAFKVLLGRESSSTDLEGKAKVKKTFFNRQSGAEAVFKQIEDALAKSRAVAAGTRKFTPGEKERAKQEGHSANEFMLDGIVALHAYTILGVRGSGETGEIQLRNPWGRYGRNDNPKDWELLKEKGEEAKKNTTGVFWIGITEFLKWFDTLDISGEVRSRSKDTK
ncbi:MAG: DUF4157 domain-containing protein [Iphinoe sp. HA4291-MV1]|nr:DUF4157 domain-containing protein [Iphinoe sp. HA4291-MV1]